MTQLGEEKCRKMSCWGGGKVQEQRDERQRHFSPENDTIVLKNTRAVSVVHDQTKQNWSWNDFKE